MLSVYNKLDTVPLIYCFLEKTAIDMVLKAVNTGKGMANIGPQPKVFDVPINAAMQPFKVPGEKVSHSTPSCSGDRVMKGGMYTRSCMFLCPPDTMVMPPPHRIRFFWML